MSPFTPFWCVSASSPILSFSVRFFPLLLPFTTHTTFNDMILFPMELRDKVSGWKRKILKIALSVLRFQTPLHQLVPHSCLQHRSASVTHQPATWYVCTPGTLVLHWVSALLLWSDMLKCSKGYRRISIQSRIQAGGRGRGNRAKHCEHCALCKTQHNLLKT